MSDNLERVRDALQQAEAVQALRKQLLLEVLKFAGAAQDRRDVYAVNCSTSILRVLNDGTLKALNKLREVAGETGGDAGQWQVAITEMAVADGLGAVFAKATSTMAGWLSVTRKGEPDGSATGTGRDGCGVAAGEETDASTGTGADEKPGA